MDLKSSFPRAFEVFSDNGMANVLCHIKQRGDELLVNIEQRKEDFSLDLVFNILK